MAGARLVRKLEESIMARISIEDGHAVLEQYSHDGRMVDVEATEWGEHRVEIYATVNDAVTFSKVLAVPFAHVATAGKLREWGDIMLVESGLFA